VNIAPGIRTALAADTDVAAVVGTRIYFQRLPQEPTYPALTIEQITTDLYNTVNELQGLHWSRIRVHAWAQTYAAADTLAATVQTALNGKKITVSGLKIRSVVADGPWDSYDATADIYQLAQDFRIWHRGD